MPSIRPRPIRHPFGAVGFSTHQRRFVGRVLAAALMLGSVASPSVPSWAQSGSSATPVPGSPSDEVHATLEAIRAKYNMPSLAGGFSVGTSVLEYAATGWRQWGSDAKVTDDDVYHLGSVTKSLTGTVIARLVEQGTLAWDTPLEQLLPGITMRAEYKGINLTMLMAHRSGISGVTYPPGLGAVPFNGLPVSPEQRKAYIQFILNQAPTSAPGTKYEYSNPGTATAAFVAEQRTGKTIEQLATELVWQPLGMTSCSMGTIWPSATTQPNPHRWSGTTPVPAPIGSGNSRVIDGADQSRCSARDVLIYARAHTTGEALGGILKRESWQDLHTVRFPGQDYAAGWVVSSNGGEPLLGHAGSNTLNYATITFAPRSQLAVVVLTNIGVSLPENNNNRTSLAEREAYAALSGLALRRQAALAKSAVPTTVPSTTTPTATSVVAQTPTSVASKTAKKKCTVNPRTKKKVCK